MKTDGNLHGKAAALLSYALDIDNNTKIDAAQLNRLVDEVCEDETERARLISLLSTSQSTHLPVVLLELLGRRLDRVKDALEMVDDIDTVYGVWGQRLTAGGILAGIGFVATAVISGGWGVLAICAALLSGGATSYGRYRLKQKARASRRSVEQTERLIETIKGNLSKSS